MIMLMLQELFVKKVGNFIKSTQVPHITKLHFAAQNLFSFKKIYSTCVHIVNCICYIRMHSITVCFAFVGNNE